MRNQKGQALVEFAIILPLLFLLIFGIFEFGRAMYIKNTLNNAARSAVRVAVVTPDLAGINYSAGQLSTRSTTDQIQAKIYDNLLYINKATATATVEVFDNTGTIKTTAAIPGDTVTVIVTADFNSIVSKITDTLQIKVPATLSGQASMRYE